MQRVQSQSPDRIHQVLSLIMLTTSHYLLTRLEGQVIYAIALQGIM